MEEEILEMEVEPDEPRIAPRTARIAFLSLAAAAGVVFVATILIVAFAPGPAVALLVGALVLLAAIVVAEVVLLMLARPRRA